MVLGRDLVVVGEKRIVGWILGLWKGRKNQMKKDKIRWKVLEDEEFLWGKISNFG